ASSDAHTSLLLLRPLTTDPQHRTTTYSFERFPMTMRLITRLYILPNFLAARPRRILPLIRCSASHIVPSAYENTAMMGFDKRFSLVLRRSHLSPSLKHQRGPL